MDVLKTLLNLHLASDSSAVLNLPYVIDVLSPEHFSPSPHLPKWTTRLNSLLHSKDAGARWAVCTELAGSGDTDSFKSTPVIKAAINLCRIVFTNATDTPEFQRQVSTPNVPKFTAAMIVFLEKDFDPELKALALTTLTRLVPSYPNIHRAYHTALISIVSRILESPLGYIQQNLVGPASKLHSVLHFTGGKVGAASLWRKAMDESFGSAWNSFNALRTQNGHSPPLKPLHDDPATSFILSFERLQCSVLVLCDLLRTTTQRPVQVPMGPLAKFATAMITVTKDEEKVEGHVDPAIHAMELSIIPTIWKLACDLITCLAKCVGRHLSPYLARLCSYIAFHLEQKLSSTHRLPFLEALYTLLERCHPLHSTIVASRLTRVILSSMSIVLPTQADIQLNPDQNAIANQNKKGKKKARTYEGDELFRSSLDVICPTADDGKALLTACDIMQLLLRNPDVAPAVHSLASRVLLAILLSLPALTPPILSSDPRLYGTLVYRVRKMTLELGAGTTSAMSKSLGLVIGAVTNTDSDEASLRELDSLLHPRVPPLVRSIPQVESLSLFRAEESAEEARTREELSLGTVQTDIVSACQEDITMTEATPQAKSTPQKPQAPVEAPPPLLPLPSVIQSAEQDTSVRTTAEVSKPAPIPVAQVVPAAPSFSRPPEPPKVPPKATPAIARERPTVASAITPDTLDVDEAMPSIDVDSDSDSE